MKRKKVKQLKPVIVKKKKQLKKPKLINCACVEGDTIVITDMGPKKIKHLIGKRIGILTSNLTTTRMSFTTPTHVPPPHLKTFICPMCSRKIQAGVNAEAWCQGNPKHIHRYTKMDIQNRIPKKV